MTIGTYAVQFWVRSDNILHLDAILGESGEPLAGATVTVDVFDEVGDPVTPQQTLEEVGDVSTTRADGTVVTARRYRTVLDRAVPFERGHRYEAVFILTHPDGHDLEVRTTAVAKVAGV